MATKKVTTKAKAKAKAAKLVTDGRLYIKATFNNTIVTITDEAGNVLSWNSTGKTGFKGARKSTPYAATTTIEAAVNEAKTKGLSSVAVYIKGPGPGRDAVLRVLRNAQLEINSIADVTPIPHNGCRPKKPRRV